MNILLLTVAVAVCQISFAAWMPDSKVLETFESLEKSDLRHTDPLRHKEAIRQKDAFEYMRTFGYLNRRPKAMTWADYEDGMTRVQKMMGLPQTGIADDATIEMMHQERCGNPDGHVYSMDDDRDWEDEREWEEGLNTAPGEVKKDPHSKRYVLTGGKWGSRDIWYRVTGYKSGMDKADWDRSVSNGFKKWAAVTTLTFTPTKCTGIDFEIYFGGTNHASPTTGPICNGAFASNTLAHGYFPTGDIQGIGGDAHFNQLKNWAYRPSSTSSGYSMEIVATHEFGHNLGLKHSNVADSLMHPYYPHANNGASGVVLKQDDINAIQAIYGDQNTPYGRPTPLPAECIDTARQY